MQEHVLWYQQLGMGDVGVVGGKNASLGEMISNLANAGVQVPGGFATTAHAFNLFLEQSGLEARIHVLLDDLDIEDIAALGMAGETIRNWIIDTPFLPELENAIRVAFKTLQGEAGDEASFAVRSSATAEDMPDASFAGQQETFLNVKGYDSVMVAIKHVFASLFNDRAISYRVHQGYDHKGVALSAGIQRMVRSDCSASGVMFSIDTESGFEDVVFITSSYGLGEMVVQGAVNPDEFYVHKPTLAKGFPAVVRRNLGSKLTKMIYSEVLEHGKQVEIVDIEPADSRQFSLNDDEIMELAKQAVIIEKHYQRPMDIEWAKDGIDGKLYIVQARPETVRSREDMQVIERFMLKGKAKVVCEGRAIGHKIGAGVAKVLKGVEQMDKIQPGDVLVTDMTDPDWEPIMKKASAIVTNRGGRTCHAAIIARELGIPAVVGCGNATASIENGDNITVSCAEGDTGFIYGDVLDFDVVTSRIDAMPEIPLKVMMNVGNPDRAFDFARLPHAGVGLARLEFIINRMIGVHPKALLDFDNQPSELKEEITDMIAGYASPVEFYIEKLVEGISTIASAFSPEKVIVRAFAAHSGKEGCVAMIVDAGANPNVQNKVSTSSSHFDSMIWSDTNLNDPHQSGTTPLMLAAVQGHLGCVNLLLEAGAQPDMKNIYGETALVMSPPIHTTTVQQQEIICFYPVPRYLRQNWVTLNASAISLQPGPQSPKIRSVGLIEHLHAFKSDIFPPLATYHPASQHGKTALPICQRKKSHGLCGNFGTTHCSIELDETTGVI